MVHLKVLELCCMKLMVQIYTTGPNNSTLYNSSNRRLAIGTTGVLSIVPIGRMAIGRIGRISPIYIIIIILILL